MKKKKKQKKLGETQFSYTPDPGTVEGPVQCGVCGTEMEVKRDCYGPRGFAMAMSGSKSGYDSFQCPLQKEDWHRQVVKILETAHETPSSVLENMLRQEVKEILESRIATKKVSQYF